MRTDMADCCKKKIVIIGCGIVGSAIAYDLSQYNLDVTILEKGNDVSLGATRANSAIIHAGYDPETGSLMARLNVRGAELAEELCRRLDVPYRKNGALVLAFSEQDMETVRTLYARGKANGVRHLEVINAGKVHDLEPNVSDEVVGALYAPDSAICSPWEYCLAFAETAVRNGAKLHLNTEVIGLEKCGDESAVSCAGELAETDACAGAEASAETDACAGAEACAETDACAGAKWRVLTTSGEFMADYVINAAGVDAGKVHGMAMTAVSEEIRKTVDIETEAAPQAMESVTDAENKATLGEFCVGKNKDWKMIPTRGQYWLLDKTEGGMTARTLFQCPSAVGKGVLIAPTVHGNLIVGPDSEILPEEDTSTTAGGLAFVKSAAARSIPNINFRANIRNFAGVRARSDSKDFIIEEAEPGFVDVAGICSPGLSAAPAIAEYVRKLMEASGLEFMKKDDVVTTRKRIRFKELSNPEKAELVAKCPAYGNIICRCETVTEGEILAAFDEPIPPTTVDAVKRRVGTGMGRCQGGFCGPNVVNILSRKLGIPPEEVLKDAAGSYILEVRDVSGSATSDGVSESVKCNGVSESVKCNGVSEFAECEQNPEVRDV